LTCDRFGFPGPFQLHAKVILAGDTQQLQAVENGGGLSQLAEALGFVQLAEPAWASSKTALRSASPMAPRPARGT
jgi:ATP-dependent exoDNAse (exonuclease V) alpha subunit